MAAAMATGSVVTAFAISTIALSANLLAPWAYSAIVRGETKTVANPEDVRGAAVAAADPPEVARVLRAHTNAMAAIADSPIVYCAYCEQASICGLDLRGDAREAAGEHADLAASLAKRTNERRLWRIASAVALAMLVVAAIVLRDEWRH